MMSLAEGLSSADSIRARGRTRNRAGLARTSLVAVALVLTALTSPGGVRAAGGEVTVQGQLHHMTGDSFDASTSPDYYSLWTADASYRLELSKPGMVMPVGESQVSVTGKLSGRTLVVDSIATDSASPNAAPSAALIGNHRVVVLLVNFTDNHSQPFSVNGAYLSLFSSTRSVSAFYNESSWGQLTMSGDVFGWYTLPMSAGSCDTDAIATAAENAATNAGVKLSTYDHIVFAFPRLSCFYWAGLGTTPGNMVWVNGELDTRVVAHELGHNLGREHASSYYCYDNGASVALSSTCYPDEYGDPFSVMGGADLTYPHDFDGYERACLGWIGETDVRQSGIVQLASLETRNPGAIQEIRIPHDAKTYLTLDFRQSYGVFDNFGSSAAAVKGVMLRLAPTCDSSDNTDLLDLHPNTESFNDAALYVGQSFTDPASGVTVTLNGISSGVASLSIQIGGTPVSTRPVLTPAVARSGSPIHVASTATDRQAVTSASVTVDGSFVSSMTADDGAFGGTSEAVSGAFVPGAGSATAIAAGENHACAMLSNGTVECWGDNSNMQLGSSGPVSSQTPLPVPGLTGVKAISAGGSFTCALLNSGTVTCWGADTAGELGDGGGYWAASGGPTVISGVSGAVAITAGSSHACALLSSGSVTCWGSNDADQLGNAGASNPSGPVTVQSLAGAKSVSAGGDSTCATVTGGAVKCWGANDVGQLNDSAAPSSTPVTIGGLSGVTSLSVGATHICVVLGSGGVKCWGDNWHGELGVPMFTADGWLTKSSTPLSVEGVSGSVTLAAGAMHTCVLHGDGSATCWGEDSSGQLGVTATDQAQRAVTVPALYGATSISGGGAFTCARTSGGWVACWGDNTTGQLGDGTAISRALPMSVSGIGGLAIGSHTVCVRASDPEGFSGQGPCATLTIANPPSAPLSVTAERGHQMAEVRWAPPAYPGGGLLTYVATSQPGGKTCTSSGALYCTVSGLDNGTTYRFSVTATNPIGTGPASAPSTGVTPAPVPDPPTGVRVAGANGSAVVGWTQPAANGSPITAYHVVATPGGASCTWTSGPLSCTVRGLVNLTQYTFTVTATNSIGVGPESAPSTAVTPGSSSYHPMSPVRLLDTRAANGHSGRLVANMPMTFSVAGRAGIPLGASAVTGNLTVASPSNGWAVYLGPNPIASPLTSTINFSASQTTSNGLSVALGSTGTLSATFMSSSGSTTDLVFDVTGYFTPDSSGDTYHPIDPVRELDTRSGNGLSFKLRASTPATFQVTGRNGIPATAKAVTGNVTAVDASAGWAVYLGPVGLTSPTTSTVNFLPGAVASNNLTVALSATGTLSATLMGPAGAMTDLVFDVTGYYTADSTGVRFVPLSPARLLDTRVANGISGMLAADSPQSFQVATRGGVVASATAVTGNLTIVGESAGWAVFVGPRAIADPTTSTINFVLGDVQSNGLTVALSPDGTLYATYMSNPGNTTNLVFDVTGCFVN